MAIKKATTSDDMPTVAERDAGDNQNADNMQPSYNADGSGQFPEPVYGGPVATGVGQTVPVGGPAPDNANETDSGAVDPDVEVATVTDPWGTKVTTDKDSAEANKDENGYS